MATGFNLTTFDGSMKAYYTRDFIKNMTYDKRPGLAMIKKFDKMKGTTSTNKGFIQPVLFGNPQARSASFSQAQSRSTAVASNIAAFSVTRVKNYSIVTVDGETLEASQDDGAFFEAVRTATDGAFRATSIDMASNLWRAGFGKIGVINNAIAADPVITLLSPEDVVNFEKDMVLNFSLSESADTLRAGTGTVLAVNRSLGTVTLTANLNTIAGLANGDTIFVKGDREDSATPTRLKMAGYGDWVPAAAPSSTAFFGVNRTSDSRLGGLRFTGTGGTPIEETLTDMAMLVSREGGMADYAFMNPSRVGRLSKSLDTQKRYVDVTVGKISFPGFEVDTSFGTIKVIPDPFVPATLVAMTQWDTFMMGSLGGAPRFLHHSGQESLFMPSDDGIEFRVGYYGNVINKAPGWNCNGTID